MANQKKTSKAASALKRRLQATNSNRTKVAKKPLRKQQPHRLLTKAFETKQPNQNSTNHNTGRRDVCHSLDQHTIGQQVSEALRNINKQINKKPTREERAQQYEHHQQAVSQTMDELSRLMSN